jgi:multiple sugar transport system substrate-binding protein
LKMARTWVAGGGATVVALGLIVASATAVAQAQGRPERAAGPTVTLQFWNAYNETDAEASTMANIVIPKFEQEHPNIKVVSDVYPYGQLLQKLLAAAAAGNPPDVVRSDIIWVPQLAKEGVILPLSKDMPGFSYWAKRVYPGPLSTNYWQGQYYGLPLDTNTQVLFWNKADFAAAHISSPPRTVAQIFADAVKLTNPAKKQYGLDLQGTDMWNLDPWIWSMGGAITNPTYTKAEGYLNGKATVAAMTTLVNLFKQHVINPDILGGAGVVGGESAFPKGISAMYIDGPWGAQYYDTAFPHLQYGMEPLPSSVTGGEDVVIPAGSKHIQAAELFVKFLESPFAQLEMATAGQMSVMKTIGPAEASLHSYYAPFAKQLLTAQARIPVPQYNQIDSDFSNDMQAAFRGKMTVQAALNMAASQAQALLNQNG